MNFKSVIKMASVVVIATKVVLGRVWLNRPVRQNDAQASDDYHNNIEEYTPVLNDYNEDFIDPDAKHFPFPELGVDELRKNVVSAERHTSQGFKSGCAKFMPLRIAGVL